MARFGTRICRKNGSLSRWARMRSRAFVTAPRLLKEEGEVPAMKSAKSAMGIVIVGLFACGCFGKVSDPQGGADQGGGGGGGGGVAGGPAGAPAGEPQTDPGHPDPPSEPSTPPAVEDAGPLALDAGPPTSFDASDPGDGGCLSDSGTRCNRQPGEACTNDGECASGFCFVGDQGNTFCSVECTADNAATVCNFGSHTCNERGLCNQ
jgi:hypothetical protein